MDLDAIRVLLAVVEQGTVHGAAQALGTSRATVRRRLQDLEASAGVPLVERALRGMTPTLAGLRLASRGRLLVEDVGLLLEEIRSLSDAPTHRLRLLCAEGLAPHYLARLLVRILDRAPEIRMELRQSSDPMGELLEGTDVAAVFNRGEREGPWQKIPLTPTPERLIASPTYLEANPVRTVADLAHRRIFVWRSPEDPTDLLPVRSGGGLAILPHVVSSDIYLLHQLALEGGGIAFVPDGGVQYERAPASALVRVLPEEVGRDCWLSLVAADSLRTLPKVLELMAAAQEFAHAMRTHSDYPPV